MTSTMQMFSAREKPWRVARYSRAGYIDLVGVCFLGDLIEFQVYELLVELEAAIDWPRRERDGSRFALLFDTNAINNAPPGGAEALRNFMATNRARFRSYSACTAIVTDGLLLRLFLRALFAVQPPAGPVEIVCNFAHALEHLATKSGATMPELIELEALGFHLDADGSTVAGGAAAAADVADEHFEAVRDA
jgi:hypothetical protein